MATETVEILPDHQGLPNHTQSPPGGWRCRMPETGQEFKGHSEHQVIVQLKASYKANGYPEPLDYKGMIESYVCSKVPDYCTGNAATSQPVQGFTFHTVLQGMQTLGAWLLRSAIKGKRDYVPQAVADQRARTCVTSGPGGSPCPFNDEPQGCTNCNSRVMKEALRVVVGDRHTPLDAQLKSCRVCQCNLAAKVHLPLLVLVNNMPDDQIAKLPAHCWMVVEQQMADAMAEATAEATAAGVPLTL